MPTIEQLADLAKRQITRECPDGYYLSGRNCYPNGAWWWWGRWVFAGLCVLFFVATLLVLARNSRRRRRRGLAPLRGTGWMAPAPPYYPPPPQYTPNAPPGGPIYSQGTGQKFNQNDGYYGNQNMYGNQQEGIQLQQPQQAYQPATYPHNGEPVYAPPEGPPPPKHT